MSEFQEYPRYFYHPKHAPDGRVFQNADETKTIGRGWVKTPADFPKPSKLTLWLKESFEPWWTEWEWLVKAFAVIVGAVGAIILLLKAFYL